MTSKILIKLIDQAILPAVLLVGIKIISVVLIVNYLEIQYNLDFLKFAFENREDFLLINTWSSFFMYVCVLGGLSWVTFKARVFHDTHITPVLSAKLYGLNLNDLIHSSEVIYTQSFIWLSYAWLCTVVFGLQLTFNLTDGWLFYFSLSLSVFVTLLLVLDIEKELYNKSENVQTFDDNFENVVKFSEIKKEILG